MRWVFLKETPDSNPTNHTIFDFVYTSGENRFSLRRSSSINSNQKIGEIEWTIHFKDLDQP